MERQYKNTGIEWIGSIPREWKICRLKDIGYLYGGLARKSGSDFDVEEGDEYALFIPFTNIFNNDVINPSLLQKVKVDINEVQNEVKEGDLLFLMSSEDYDGIGKSSILQNSISKLYLNSFCKGMRITNPMVLPKYLFYLMSSHFVREQLRLEAKGFIRINLRQDKLLCCSLFLPPIGEQQRIAEFLDVKCREIDGLITLQEQMIAQLTDYKQSVITEIVTKGLIPDAQLVPSGIDWIAVIPKGWKNVRFYYSNWIRGRLGWKGLKSEEYTESGYPFLSAFNIINNKLDWSDINYINQERYDESPEIKLKVGDILLVKDGAGIGKCARIDELPLGESTVNSSLAVITPKAFLNYKYLYYYLQSNSFWSIINLLLVGMGVPHLTQTNMKNIKMPLPPLEEQVVIAEYLDAKCGEIDRLIETKRQKIETLKEYKKSVIYEAVTGKTDLWDS